MLHSSSTRLISPEFFCHMNWVCWPGTSQPIALTLHKVNNCRSSQLKVVILTFSLLWIPNSSLQLELSDTVLALFPWNLTAEGFGLDIEGKHLIENESKQ